MDHQVPKSGKERERDIYICKIYDEVIHVYTLLPFAKVRFDKHVPYLCMQNTAQNPWDRGKT